ncbi:tetratricopeptide repeat protein [Chloroflexota bacterium]
MKIPSSLIEIKNILPQSSWPQVIHALRQDELIWQALQEPDFRNISISRLGNRPEMWTPANLALLALKTNLDTESFLSASLIELDPELRLQAIQTYETHVAESPSKMTLPTAGLLALALLEHHRVTQSWENIPHRDHWRTAHACLFSLTNHSISLLHSLPIPIFIHTILANPLPTEAQVEMLASFSASLTTRERLELLRELNHHRPDLSIPVARKLWRVEGETLSVSKENQIINPLEPFTSIQKLFDELNTSIAQAEAQLTAGYNDKGANALNNAWQTTRHLQQKLASQVTQFDAFLGNLEKSQVDWTDAQKPPSMPHKDIAALALIWLEQGNLKEAQKIIENLEDTSEPMVFLAHTCLYIEQGNLQGARESALHASQAAPGLSVESQLWLAKKLLELKLATEAIQVIELAMQSQPNHIGIIRLAAQAHAAAGAYSQAILAIHLAVAFKPNKIDIKRDYALYHELAGRWRTALETRKNIIQEQKDPQQSDYHYLAECGLKLEQYPLVQKVCESALEQNPKDGIAHALIGESLSEMGKIDNAEEHLHKGIKYAQDKAQPWLALARFQKKAGNQNQATETLRKAFNAAPEQAEIHLILGDEYLRGGAHTQALTYLRKAEHLIDYKTTVEDIHLRSRIALPLAKSLFELGHADEALEKIQMAFPLPENQVEFLHLHAQILIFLKRTEKAIPLLAKALMTDPSNSAITIDYAQAILDANHDPDKAINTLLALLERDPKNAEALAWLAQALQANGDPTNALTTYRKALGTRLKADPHWYPRLSIGLAQSALELGQPETALAALQRDWQTSPQNHLDITQTMALAYKQAHLFEKALQTAHSVQEIAPDSLANLIWFAEFADEIQAYDEAIGALKRAIDLGPDLADLQLKLGMIYKKIGDFEEAQRTFRQVAQVDLATPNELRMAAMFLMELDIFEDAIVSLKIAIQRCTESTENQKCPELIIDLIDIYRQLGQHAEALEYVDGYLEQQVDKNPTLVGKRAILQYLLGNDVEAYETLDQGFSQNPNNIPLHLSASQVHYNAGNLTQAFDHANQALDSINRNEASASLATALTQAADIADACLNVQTANEIIQHESIKPDFPVDLSYLCLRSELALRSSEEVEAANSLTTALEISPEHPRVLALQARLTARHGDLNNAHQLLQKAFKSFGESQNQEIESPACLLGISETALELHEWNPAIYLLQEAVEQFPQEPRTHLSLARGLVLRAEFQRLCETLRVIQHAPGQSALAHFTYQQFEQAIMTASNICEKFNFDIHQSVITHWRVRGQSIFQPSEEHTRALDEIPQTPESHADFLAALRSNPTEQSGWPLDFKQLEPSFHQLVQQSDNPIMTMVEIALLHTDSNPELALEVAQNVLDASIRHSNPSQPVFYAFQAYIAEQTGKLDFAGLALEKALSHWENEARWHLWAAEIQLAQERSNYEIVFECLSQATSLEPRYGLHYLTLGQAYLQTNNPQDAIPALEEATRLLSGQAISWLTLANAQHASGDIPKIFHNAERAAELDPTNNEPHILLVKSALDINNPKKAIHYCQKALKIIPMEPQILLLNARALDMLGKSGEALESFDHALENTPKSVELMLEHARLTRRAGGNRAEIEELQALSIEHPENSMVLAALAEAFVDNNQPEPAIIAAQKALQTNQGNLGDLQEAQLHKTMGRLMRRTGQLDQAIHYLSKAIQNNPESVESYLELGRVYQVRRQYSTALDAFQQAIALDPGNATAYYQAGQTLKSAKDYTAAEEMLQSAAKLAPDDLGIRRQLGGLVALNLVHNRKQKSELYVE